MNENQSKAISATYWSIAGNTLMALVKGLGGILGHSQALIADAIESTTDIFASILVLFGLRYANKPADEDHPYGHGKAEPLITFVVVFLLIISAVIIAYTSIENIKSGKNEIPEKFTLIILGIIIIVKEVFFQVIYRKGKQTNSTALMADAWHHRSDAITSVTAFAGVAISIYMGKGYESADDWAALLASFFIIYNAFKIFRPALGEIMDEHLYDDMIETIRTSALKVKHVSDTEKCHVRKMGMNYIIDLHLMVNGNLTVREGHQIAHKVQDQIMNDIPSITKVFIHVEPYYGS